MIAIETNVEIFSEMNEIISEHDHLKNIFTQHTSNLRIYIR
jgi:hypothetical protein